MRPNFTRGSGILENFLARQRARLANSLIPSRSRAGRILDIGCGLFPYFLSSVNFQEKFGLDKNFSFNAAGINLVQQDLEKNNRLPFVDNYFEAVTALAFLEHLEFGTTTEVLREIYRILKPDGVLVITVPGEKIDLFLKLMSKVKLVSAVEINEHKVIYNRITMGQQLATAGFEKEKIKHGSFELRLNNWFYASK